MSILMLLQTRGRVSARVLAGHLEVSPRTVYRDIDELSAAGVPVVVQRGASGGFELLDGWRTTLTGLTPTESQTLLLSGLPGPVEALGLGDTMASAQLKLLAALPRDWQAGARRVSSRVHVDLAGWYRRLAPAPHLRPLADAVWAERRVTIEYESWKGLVEREVEPLGLVIKGGEWYLVARPPGRRDPEPRTYRVSNIRSLALGSVFARPDDFDLAACWTESTRRFERELVRGHALVRITPRGRRLLRGMSAALEEAVDRSAAVEQMGWQRVTIPIESIENATEQLLALGTEVEVLEPAALRERLRDVARAVAAMHSGQGPAAATDAARPKPRRPARRRRTRIEE